MQVLKALENEILTISSEISFNNLALKVFELQKHNVPIYKAYIKSLPTHFQAPDHYSKIPFLPIEFFKHIRSFLWKAGSVLYPGFIALLSRKRRVFSG